MLLRVPLERILTGGEEKIRLTRPDIETEDAITITIPAGIREGTALRVAGHGLPSEVSGGAPGDLFVIVRTLPNPLFERDGADLHCTLKISIEDAVLGAGIKIQTLEGYTNVAIPQGTQPETVLRLKGKGLPEFKLRGKGDFFIRIKVQIPKTLSSQERDLYEQLRRLSQGRKAA